MKKIIYISVLFVVLVSCNNKQDNLNDYLTINNKMLENEISTYINNIDSLVEEPHIFNVTISSIDHSTSKYVIDYRYDTNSFENFPYHFVCIVNNHKVYFTVKAALVMTDKKNRNFFINKKEAILQIMKKQFPKEYSEYQYFLETGIENRNFYYNKLPMCELVFRNDSLVKKVMRGGLPW